MNIGVIIPSLAASEYAFYTVNQCHFLKQVTPHEPFIFVEDIQPPCMQLQASCMNISEVFSFAGMLISTNLRNTAIAINAKTAAKKIFYVWDLEFLRRGNNDFLRNNEIYRSPEVKIVCRSIDHAKVFENYSNRRPDAIIPSINLLGIYNEFVNK